MGKRGEEEIREEDLLLVRKVTQEKGEDLVKPGHAFESLSQGLPIVGNPKPTI